MIWRRSFGSDQAALLSLSKDPMGGKVRLIWGFRKLRAPEGCDKFRAYAIEREGKVAGCAFSWDWPGGHRYLSGLRFGGEMATRPRPAYWKHAFESLLENVSCAWTSIGRENRRARRILESGVKWLPRYEPRQKITTWFVPLGARQAKAGAGSFASANPALQVADWRYVAIASGKGWGYRAGRFFNACGLRGIPRPNRPIRIGYYHPSPGQSIHDMRNVCHNARGIDGIVVVLPDDSELGRRWEAAAPRMSWKWFSTLYSVSWNRNQPLPEVPQWKGLWL